jgi:hypothetical protein
MGLCIGSVSGTASGAWRGGFRAQGYRTGANRRDQANPVSPSQMARDAETDVVVTFVDLG